MVLHVQAEGPEFRSQHPSLTKKLASCLLSQHQGDRDKQISGCSVPCLAELEVSLSKKQGREENIWPQPLTSTPIGTLTRMPVCAHAIVGREQRQREGIGEATLTQLLSAICGYLQSACHMRVLLWGGPAQASTGKDLWFTCMQSVGMGPSLVSFGCVCYELW